VNSARIVDLADGVADYLRDEWRPVAPDAVTRVWPFKIDLDGNARGVLLKGRQVWVMPALPGMDRLTRAGWQNKHQIGVLLTETFTDRGEGVPDDWIDDRVKWWQDTILYPLADPRLVIGGPAGVVTAARPDPEQPPEVAEFVDPEELLQLKLLKISATFSFIDNSDFTGA
jgi:hypothetical protein